MVLAMVLVGSLMVPLTLARENKKEVKEAVKGAKVEKLPGVSRKNGVTEKPSKNSKTPPTSTQPAKAPVAVAPVPTAQAKSATAAVPQTSACGGASSGVGLANWYLTLPIGTEGSPTTIHPPQLAGFTQTPYIYAKDGGLAFRAHAGGATTKNSAYPRSELREMIGGKLAGWDNGVGTHCMRVRQAVTAIPSVKPHVVTAQIHDSSDDVVMVRLEGKHLFVEQEGRSIGSLDENYTLGKVFTVVIESSGGRIRVHHDGVKKIDISRPAKGCYFKAGVYTQSNPSKGESPEAFGEVVIYDLQVSHT
jgi:poly(beta-D-mannuronate) lyase